MGSPFRPPDGPVWLAGVTISWIYEFSVDDPIFAYIGDHQSTSTCCGPITGQLGHIPPLRHTSLRRRQAGYCFPLKAAEPSLAGQERRHGRRRSRRRHRDVPSWTTAQPQAAQGCAVCGDPSDPMKEERESAKRTACRGRRPLVLCSTKNGSFQSHLPQPEGRAKPRRGQRPRIRWGKIISRALLRNALRRWRPPPPGDAFPPATGL